MTVLSQFSKDLEDLIKKISPSVFSIHTPTGSGSSFVFTPDGFMVSNAHVVQSHTEVLAESFDKEPLPATVIGRDQKTDLALLKLNKPPADFLSFKKSDPQIGQIVIAAGSPLRFQQTITMGVVSALHRQLPMKNGFLEGLIQTDAAINPGNSGGPLISTNGEVLGINTAIVPYAQGLGFAVSARTAEWIVSELLRFGKVRRKFLGIRGLPVIYADEFQNKKNGIRVLDVEAKSPARLAGIAKDDILISINSTPLKFIDDLQKILALKEQDMAEITVRRGKKILNFYVQDLHDAVA
ncbi:trypsin-like peptidase domain-containing protein [bacterium]|nr:trypsin-like peptidase domain-containing protein [bacterium]